MDDHALNIAIDFGTARTKAAFYNPSTEQAEVIRLGHSRVEHIPSLFHISNVDGQDQILFAEDAEREGRRNPAGLLIGVKSKIDDSRPIRRRSQTTRKDLLVDLFKHIKEMSSTSHQEYATTVCCCQLTVPVGFEESKRDAIRDAASLAGFVNIELIEEPVAAARAWLRSNTKGVESIQRVIVFDIGGGTCDYALLNRHSETFQVDDKVAPSGNANLGGNDLDDILREVLEDEFPDEISALGAASVCNELRLAREAWHLHRGESIELHFSGEQSLKVPRALIEEETRTFCRLIIDDFERFLSKCETAGVPGDVPIAMIGGGSRILGLREALQAHTARTVLTWDQSDFAVVKGAVQLPDSKDSTGYSAAEGKYRVAVELAWQDGAIEEVELRNLKESAQASGLSPEKIEEIEHEIIGMNKEAAHLELCSKQYDNIFKDVTELILEGRSMEALSLAEKAVIHDASIPALEAWVFCAESIPSQQRMDESAERIANASRDTSVSASIQVIAHCLAHANEPLPEELENRFSLFEIGSSFSVTLAAYLKDSVQYSSVGGAGKAYGDYPDSVLFELYSLSERLISVEEEDERADISSNLKHFMDQAPYSAGANSMRLLLDAMEFLASNPNEYEKGNFLLSSVDREALYHRLASQSNLTLWQKIGEASLNITRSRVEHIHEDIDACIESPFCGPEIRCMLHQVNASIYEQISGVQDALSEYRKLYEFQSTWEHAKMLLGYLHAAVGELVEADPISVAKHIEEFRKITQHFFLELLDDKEAAPLVAVYLLQQLSVSENIPGLSKTLGNTRKLADRILQDDPTSEIGRALLFSSIYLDTTRLGQSIEPLEITSVFPNIPEETLSVANHTFLPLEENDVCLFLHDGAIIKPGQFGLALSLNRLVANTRFSGSLSVNDWTSKTIEQTQVESKTKWTIQVGNRRKPILFAEDVEFSLFPAIELYVKEIKKIEAKNKSYAKKKPIKRKSTNQKENKVSSSKPCPQCFEPVPVDSKFCHKCGHSMNADRHVNCGACRAENPSTNKFCVACGNSL
ncbi:MAG: Hsp70 family protein [Opitutaceae bacterium]